MAHKLDSDKVRSNFPAFSKYPGFVFGDNAGGSQICKDAADRVFDYLVNTNVQMGSDYMISSTKRCLTEAQIEAVKLFNASSPDEIVFGASSTQSLENLARGLDRSVQEGDEIIITFEHEANNGPWKSLAKRNGAIVKFWKPRNLNDKNPYSIGLDTQDLIPLITSKTRLVAITACSNILGQILPVKKIIQAIRTTAKEKGSLLVEISLDCVAYAPHAQMDVQDWDVDFAVFSYYKVYGPHISGMYVRKSALEGSVKSVVHHFLSPSVDTNGYKLQPNGPGYELTWGTTAIVPYIESLTSTGTLKAGYHAIQAHDAEIAEAMLAYLTADKQRARGVRVVGSEEPTLERMPTVSFLIVDGANGEPSVKSKALINRFDKRGEIGIRYGHFYAYSLVESLKPDMDMADGVVRASFVHYNTVEDVARFISTLDDILYKE